MIAQCIAALPACPSVVPSSVIDASNLTCTSIDCPLSDFELLSSSSAIDVLDQLQLSRSMQRLSKQN